MRTLATLLALFAAGTSAFSLAPMPSQRAVVVRASAESVVMMAAKKPVKPVKKAVKKIVKKAAPKPAPKKVVRKAAPKKAAPAAGPNLIKDLFSLKFVGGAQGDVKNPSAWN